MDRLKRNHSDSNKIEYDTIEDQEEIKDSESDEETTDEEENEYNEDSHANTRPTNSKILFNQIESSSHN